MKRLWPFCLPLLIIAACIVWLRPAPKSAVALSIIGHTNNAAGVPMVVFQVTNCSTISFCVLWSRLESEHDAGPTQLSGLHLLPGRSALIFACSAPEYSGTSSWQVFVLYKRPAGTLRAGIDQLFWKLGLPIELNKWRSILSPELPMPNEVGRAPPRFSALRWAAIRDCLVRATDPVGGGRSRFPFGHVDALHAV